MSDPKKLTADVRAAVRRAGQRPPLEIFEDLVLKGFIDRQGRVTRLIGGTAEPEPEALDHRRRHSRVFGPAPRRRRARAEIAGRAR